MEIFSLKFAGLTFLTILIFYIIKPKYRVAFLTVLSCGFIASYNYYLLVYIIVYALINYIIGLKIPGNKHKIALFRIGVILNLSQLILLKYSSFAVDPFFQLIKINIQVSILSEIIIPIGISYFTLQGIGYLVNVKMGWENPENSFMSFLLYITFYPKFLSGPLERSNHFLPQIKAVKTFDGRQVSEGLKIALIGFFKKIAIANQMAPYVISTFNDPNSANGPWLWIMFFIIPLYLYFDFSGYTDIAIGIAKTLGIDLLPNFNRPFLSENVSTFWKRFHMSLSSWFNDYVFRQTSYRYRKWGIYASAYAVFITWILFGIWHGAGWNFMILGFLQALVINYEFFTKKVRLRLFATLPGLVRIWIGRFFTYSFYCISLILFFSADLKSALVYFSKLIKPIGSLQLDPISTYPISILFYIPVFLILEIMQNDYNLTYNKFEKFWEGEKISGKFLRWSIYSFMISIIFVFGNKVEQFVYVNF